jgi:hypothetical protein
VSINISRLQRENTSITDVFFDAAAWAGEGVARRVGPTRESERPLLRFFLFGRSRTQEICMSRWRLMHRFGIGGAAMFAEPAVTEIEEMVCLVQGNRNQETVDSSQ